MAHNYKKLKVWELAMEMAKETYQLTLSFPNDEKFGLVSQIKRCAISIPSNIAEGSGRNSNKDFAKFLSMSLGSSYELETQLLLSSNLKLIDTNDSSPILEKNSEIQKMIFKLRSNLN